MDVLFVKLLAIGDVVMATAAVAALRQRSPTRLTWVCGKTVAPLLAIVPGIDELIVVDEKCLLTGSTSARIAEMVALWRRLGRRRFDLVATAHPDPRYRLLSMWVRAGQRRCFARDMRRSGPLTGRHHADEYVRLLLDIDGPEAPPARFPEVPAALSDALAASLPVDRPLVALVPGGNRNVLHESNHRRWPVQSYRRLAERLLASGHAVVLAGNEGDAWLRPHFSGLPVIDVIGRTSLVEAIALFRRADLTVTHDTGSLHLARLAGTPVLALFGPTTPHGFGPMRRHAPDGRAAASRSIWGGEHLACRPCYDSKSFAACASVACMASIEPDLVYQNALDILGGIEAEQRP